MINNINFELMDKYPRLDLVDQGLKVLGLVESMSKCINVWHYVITILVLKLL